MSYTRCECAITRPSADNPLGICAACQSRALRESSTRARRARWAEHAHWILHKGMPWFLSAITLYAMVLVGHKDLAGWAVGLIGQAFWLVWICGTRTWGFLPMNIALTAVYAQNLFLWRGA